MTSYVLCEQDLDNSRGIGFQEVCMRVYPRVARILSVVRSLNPYGATLP
jgi:hypothetical protein